MKSFKNVFLAALASLLLSVGFAKAAESFDSVGSGSHEERVLDGGNSPCTIIIR